MPGVAGRGTHARRLALDSRSNLRRRGPSTGSLHVHSRVISARQKAAEGQARRGEGRTRGARPRAWPSPRAWRPSCARTAASAHARKRRKARRGGERDARAALGRALGLRLALGGLPARAPPRQRTPESGGRPGERGERDARIGLGVVLNKGSIALAFGNLAAALASGRPLHGVPARAQQCQRTPQSSRRPGVA